MKPPIVETMKHNIKAYNRYITMEYLNSLTPLQLLHLTHEDNRREFAIALCKENLATTAEVYEYIKH